MSQAPNSLTTDYLANTKPLEDANTRAEKLVKDTNARLIAENQRKNQQIIAQDEAAAKKMQAAAAQATKPMPGATPGGQPAGGGGDFDIKGFNDSYKAIAKFSKVAAAAAAVVQGINLVASIGQLAFGSIGSSDDEAKLKRLAENYKATKTALEEFASVVPVIGPMLARLGIAVGELTFGSVEDDLAKLQAQIAKGNAEMKASADAAAVMKANIEGIGKAARDAAADLATLKMPEGPERQRFQRNTEAEKAIEEAKKQAEQALKNASTQSEAQKAAVKAGDEAAAKIAELDEKIKAAQAGVASGLVNPGVAVVAGAALVRLQAEREELVKETEQTTRTRTKILEQQGEAIKDAKIKGEDLVRNVTAAQAEKTRQLELELAQRAFDQIIAAEKKKSDAKIALVDANAKAESSARAKTLASDEPALIAANAKAEIDAINRASAARVAAIEDGKFEVEKLKSEGNTEAAASLEEAIGIDIQAEGQKRANAVQAVQDAEKSALEKYNREIEQLRSDGIKAQLERSRDAFRAEVLAIREKYDAMLAAEKDGQKRIEISDQRAAAIRAAFDKRQADIRKQIAENSAQFSLETISRGGSQFAETAEQRRINTETSRKVEESQRLESEFRRGADAAGVKGDTEAAERFRKLAESQAAYTRQLNESADAMRLHAKATLSTDPAERLKAAFAEIEAAAAEVRTQGTMTEKDLTVRVAQAKAEAASQIIPQATVFSGFSDLYKQIAQRTIAATALDPAAEAATKAGDKVTTAVKEGTKATVAAIKEIKPAIGQ